MENDETNKENQEVENTENVRDNPERNNNQPFIKSEVTKKATKKKKTILSVILVIILIAGGIFGYFQYSNQKAKEYKQNVKKVQVMVIVSGTKAENMINEYIQVWDKAIESRYGFELHGEYVSDFNDALQVQKSYFISNGDIDKLKKDKNEIESTVKQLKNPPKNYEEIYNLVIDLQNKYRTFSDYAIDPSGSLLSYGNDTAEISRELSDIYQEIEMRIGD